MCAEHEPRKTACLKSQNTALQNHSQTVPLSFCSQGLVKEAANHSHSHRFFPSLAKETLPEGSSKAEECSAGGSVFERGERARLRGQERGECV